MRTRRYFFFVRWHGPWTWLTPRMFRPIIGNEHGRIYFVGPFRFGWWRREKPAREEPWDARSISNKPW